MHLDVVTIDKLSVLKCRILLLPSKSQCAISLVSNATGVWLIIITITLSQKHSVLCVPWFQWSEKFSTMGFTKNMLTQFTNVTLSVLSVFETYSQKFWNWWTVMMNWNIFWHEQLYFIRTAICAFNHFIVNTHTLSAPTLGVHSKHTTAVPQQPVCNLLTCKWSPQAKYIWRVVLLERVWSLGQATKQGAMAEHLARWLAKD